MNLSIPNGDKFVYGIIQTMINRMNHPLRRYEWDLNKKKFNKPVHLTPKAELV